MKIVGALAPTSRDVDPDTDSVAAGFAHVSVLDISRADAAALVIGDTIIGLDHTRPSFPIVFEVEIDPGRIADAPPVAGPRPSYAVRAVVRDSQGGLRFTTDTVYTVDLFDHRDRTDYQLDVGTLTLVSVSPTPSRSPDTNDDRSHIHAHLLGTWTVDQINARPSIDGRPPVIEFAADGTVAGTTGCNRFSATWKLDGSQLTIGPAATTRRACMPPLDEQESAVLAALADAAGATVLLTGDTLTIDTPGAGRLTAHRSPSSRHGA